MAKRKRKKTRADKESGVTGAKETAKLTGKETAARKPTEAKPKPRPNIPSVIESPLEHIDKPVDIPQTDDQAGGVTEAILEA
ncbi:MAG: hypothetical protein NUV86_09890, partial [Candidatus Scalindua sp.]|nr:hypothetical protein [Candidatus Scalindua sp.]